MTETSRPGLRLAWIPILLVAAGLMFVGGMAILAIARPVEGTRAAPPTTGPLDAVTLDALGVRLRTPTNWAAPVVTGERRFVLSPDGNPDTSTTAGPFLFVVIDALDEFSRQLNIRTDLTDPREELDVLVDALNRERARFPAAEDYLGARYPAAIVRGFERGNELTLILMRTPDGRWIYVGAQAKEADFRYYELSVFKPATDSLELLD
ncbi:MAG: hypothetical protein IT323_11960 [Anaerolineae bacterium]|nr:hypothetical protein [Anaerolineae bacterium]